jgi:hypothetical protein
MNRWGIPPDLERLVRKRDRRCVYCRTRFVRPTKKNPRPRSLATWEHVDNDVRNLDPRNVALCCLSCNASKGARTLRVWLDSEYCRRRGISGRSVAGLFR